ncbi:MAG TPA: hypothetical protein VNO23_00590 [Candidatus Binatia bacterium]|jgi:hypothetical protein|nr:hypothetical protein [Candidatus Binatia bacterium]
MTCAEFCAWAERFLARQRGLEALPAAQNHARTCAGCGVWLERRIQINAWEGWRRAFWQRRRPRRGRGALAWRPGLVGRLEAAATILGGDPMVSVFVARRGGVRRLPGIAVARGGRTYIVRPGKQYCEVAWVDGPLLVGVVAQLGCRAVLDCAARLRGALEVRDPATSTGSAAGGNLAP